MKERQNKLGTTHLRTNSRAADNSTYKKLEVQQLNEALYFVSSFVVAESSVLRNRQLIVAAKRYLNLNPQYLPQSLNKINILQSNKT
jgi:hypothetical protein